MTMKKAATAAAGVALFTAALGTMSYIDNDGGGSVYAYVEKYEALKKNQVKATIRGNCYSSCTMGLGYQNVCLDKGSTLGFHPAYIPYMFGLFSYRVHQEATAEMIKHYPPDALAVINKHEGMKDKGGWFRPEITLIKATEFPKKYIC